MRLNVVTPAAAAAFLLLAGCGGGSSSATPAAASKTTKPAGSARIAISNFKFKPPAIQVKVGAKLTFTNNDSSPHTATSRDGKAFDTGTLKQGATKTVTVSKPGTYAYFCSFHPFMNATVKVVR